MIVVYNNKNGKIIYTIEGSNKFSEEFLNKGESYKIVNDESIRAQEYKIDIENDRITRRTKAEKETELNERQLQTEIDKINIQNRNRKFSEIETKVQELEGRLAKLESK
jgi:polyhydroxyalkanoate synthesis regulator phasin